MARHKDVEWRLADPPGNEGAQLGLLMDLRDELKRLNSLLHCQNFQNIPRELRGIRRDIKDLKKR